jgi:hypothetical protein
MKRKYTQDQYKKRLAWMREYAKEYRRNNKEKIAAYKKIYNKTHKVNRVEYQATYFKNRIQTDPLYRLRVRLRTRIKMAIKKNLKQGSTIKDLGCSIEFLKKYLESKFYSNMTWSNWGKVWQLDHVKRLADFDLTNREQLLKAVHYTNLQPLTVEDHRKKTTKEEK